MFGGGLVKWACRSRPAVPPTARLSVRPSIRPSVHPSVRLSACLSACLCVRSSVCPSFYLSICLLVCLSSLCGGDLDVEKCVCVGCACVRGWVSWLRCSPRCAAGRLHGWQGFSNCGTLGAPVHADCHATCEVLGIRSHVSWSVRSLPEHTWRSSPCRLSRLVRFGRPQTSCPVFSTAALLSAAICFWSAMLSCLQRLHHAVAIHLRVALPSSQLQKSV